MTRLVAILAALAAPASAGSLPQVSGVILDDSYAPSAKTKAPPERPGEWECWVLRTDHPYIYRLDWRQPSPEWDLAHYREACQRPHSPRRYAPSSAPRFPVTATPGPPRFMDRNPSDDSRCDGVWRPIATCD